MEANDVLLKQGEPADAGSFRVAQANHNEHKARLSDAYAAAYEGDVQFAATPGQRTYLLQRARVHRREAQCRRATARELRSMAKTR